MGEDRKIVEIPANSKLVGKNSCCPRANSPKSARANQSTKSINSSNRRLPANAKKVPGGDALLGTNHPIIEFDGESPIRSSKIAPFYIGETAVTNAEFQAFVDATNYETEAETFGWSFVFWSQVPKWIGATAAVAGVEWWRRVDGANWKDVNGPQTQSDAWQPDHPVVHISWNDANAYAHWVNGRLPTEMEWEHAARGGLEDVKFPWGDQEPNDNDFLPCNIWQGIFPKNNTAADGYLTTAPAKSFEPNGYGLFNMAGNVWEWTQDSFKRGQHSIARLDEKNYKVSKGGSFLCHKSYCYRYRIAARSGTSPDSSTTHHGFRVVWPAND